MVTKDKPAWATDEGMPVTCNTEDEAVRIATEATRIAHASPAAVQWSPGAQHAQVFFADRSVYPFFDDLFVEPWEARGVSIVSDEIHGPDEEPAEPTAEEVAEAEAVSKIVDRLPPSTPIGAISH